MKLKTDIIFPILTATAVMSSCVERVHIDDNQYSPSVYLVNNGLQKTDVFYDVQGSYGQDIRVYCASFNEALPTVSVVIDESVLDEYNETNFTAYKALPRDCYTVDSEPFEVVDRKGSTVISFDCEKLKAFSSKPDYSDLQDYAVPLRLVNHTEGVDGPRYDYLGYELLVPVMSSMQFVFTPPFANQVPKNDLPEDGDSYILTYRLATAIDNRWDFPVDFSFNIPSGDVSFPRIPEGAYEIQSSAESFSDGISEIVFTVRIKKDMLSGAAYSVAAMALSGADLTQTYSSLFDIVGSIDAYPQSSLSVYECNSDSGVEWESPEMALDGSQTTYWQANWGTGNGVIHHSGDQNYYEISFEMAESTGIAAVGIARRNDMEGRADIKSGFISVSDNGTDWTRIKDFHFPESSYLVTDNPETLIYFDSVIQTRYIKVSCDDSWRFNGDIHLVNITEFKVYVPAE